MADTQLYLGLDLGPEYTQLSYYNVDTHEPESVYHKEAKDTYMLPNIMFYSAYHKRIGDAQDECYKFIDLSGWSVGAKASAYRFEDNGTVVDQIYEKTLRKEKIDVEGREYKASDLLIKMMVLHIKQFTDQIGGFTIKRLTVTVADTDPQIIQAVRGLRSVLRLGHDQFNIVSHLDSGLCYIFAQPEPLRNNSVGLFDFGRNGLDFYRIDMTRKYPLIVTVEHTDYHERINLKRFGRYREDMDEAFADVVRESMAQVFVSSVYLTGIGFAENWMKQSAAVLCQGRRVFVGQNIYTKGACYRALGGIYTESLSRYFIDTEETVKTNIGINLMDEKKTFWPIVYGGLEWFNTRGKIEVFLDDTRRIQIVYQDILTEEEMRETVEIYGLPARPNKTTKLSIEVEYYGSDKGAIVIRDLGFGSLYPSTNKIYRKEFDIDAIKRKRAQKLEAERQAEIVRAAEGDTDELRSDDPGAPKAAHRPDLEQHDVDSVNDDDLVMDTAEPEKEPLVFYGTASPVQPLADDVPAANVISAGSADKADSDTDGAGEPVPEENTSSDGESDVSADAGNAVSEDTDDPEAEYRYSGSADLKDDLNILKSGAEDIENSDESDQEDYDEGQSHYDDFAASKPDEEDSDEEDSDEEDSDEKNSDEENSDDEDSDEENSDDEDSDDEDSDESPAFTIPSYLRRQHLDPGE